MARNRDLDYVVRPLRITPAKERIYDDHHWFRFDTGVKETLAQRYHNIPPHPAPLMEGSLFDRDRLLGFSIFELGERAILSNIGVWSPEAVARGLGTLTIIKEIEYAHRMGAKYYYFGPYNIRNTIYEYKTKFRGFELYDWDSGQWVDYQDPAVKQMLRDS